MLRCHEDWGRSHATAGRAVFEVEALHGTPPGTIMLGGRPVRIDIRESALEDPKTERGRGPGRGPD